MIYLDDGATSFYKPPTVEKAMIRALRSCTNPGRGGYPMADNAARIVYGCRCAAGEMFDCAPEQVVFTKNCTEGLNMAIRTLVHPGDRVVIESTTGGILSSPILGKPGTTLDGMIIFSIARTPSSNSGLLLALDTVTGTPAWEYELAGSTWSSPIALHTEDGIGYIVACDSQGNVNLHEATTGNLLSFQNAGFGIDASPAAFENTIIVGTNGQIICAFTVE